MLDQAIIQQLARIVGKDNCLTTPEHLAVYAYDATPYKALPQAVLLPSTSRQIADVLKLANERGFPVIPRGAGTNLSGGSTPPGEGAVVSTTRMNRILEVDERNLTAVVQPGVILGQFQQQVESKGLFYPPDPASNRVCTLGGNAAMSAGGLRCVKYGTTKDYIIGLEVVLPTGEVIHTGGKTVKNVAGYDLTHLFVGCEGTLGIITELTLRLIPLPEARKTCLAIFDSVDAAAQTVASVIGARIIPRAMELMDKVSINAVEDFRSVGLPRDAQAILLIEVDGSAQEVGPQIEKVIAACQENGVREVRVATTEEEAEALWTARRAQFAALARVRPNIIVEDVTVPRPYLPRLIKAVHEAARRHNVMVGLVSHAGDGNLHPQILCDLRDQAEMARIEGFMDDTIRATLELGGSITGEHGVGSMKVRYLPWQYGKDAIQAMQNIKKALDPKGILNPDKLWRATPSAEALAQHSRLLGG